MVSRPKLKRECGEWTTSLAERVRQTVTSVILLTLQDEGRLSTDRSGGL
jgi:hypothetical protein